MNKKLGLTLMLIASVFMSFMFTFGSVAAEPLNLDMPCEIAIHYEHEGNSLNSARFSIYKVAELSSSGRFSLVGDFKDYPLKINDLTISEYAATASTLSNYVAADKIEPLHNGRTDVNGRLYFTGIPTGLYLVLGEKATQNGNEYSPVPVLVSLPTKDRHGEWQHSVVLLPKIEVRPEDEEQPDTVNRRVVKVWNDDGNLYDERPSSVKIELLRDGELFDTVFLSAENNWNHNWYDLDNNYTWLVVERNIPKNYNVLLTASETIFRVSNSHIEVGEPSTEPYESTTDDSGSGSVSGDGTQTGQGPGPTGTTDSSGGPSGGGTTKPPGKLPQTGQLLWPVPLSAGFGLLFFAAGWYMVFRKRKNVDEE